MTPLFEIIARRIESAGPMTLAEYMRLALTHPELGYYTAGDPLGAPRSDGSGGDFVTAPEVSQMFGELLGLWCADTWRFLGQPKPVKLIELGPGRGTLMADALRAVKIVPGFAENLEVHLVELSPALRRKQEAALAGQAVSWHPRLDEIPEGPFLLLANELFDALPIRQFARGADGWRERLVTLAEDGGELIFVLGPESEAAGLLIPEDRRDLPPGSIVELCPDGELLAREIGRRCAAGPGAALIVDYGSASPGGAPSFQALRRHQRHPPRQDPGRADLTP
ncbi:MAG: SAM-dependent methyltransferase, partial [Rhodovibrionaceae bacterium]